MRLSLASACIAAALLPLAQPAGATSAATMQCTFDYSTGSADCSVSGIWYGSPGTYLASMPIETGHTICPFSQGSGGDGWITWSRYGVTGVATIAGGEYGHGVMTFSSPCPPYEGTEQVTIVFASR